jgi:fumarylacetoacetase
MICSCKTHLNDFISDGKKTWRLVSNRIADIFDENNPKLRDNAKHRDIVIFKMDEVEMQLPVLIGDYTFIPVKNILM